MLWIYFYCYASMLFMFLFFFIKSSGYKWSFSFIIPKQINKGHLSIYGFKFYRSFKFLYSLSKFVYQNKYHSIISFILWILFYIRVVGCVCLSHYQLDLSNLTFQWILIKVPGRHLFSFFGGGGGGSWTLKKGPWKIINYKKKCKTFLQALFW